jgi:hypothetical protein
MGLDKIDDLKVISSRPLTGGFTLCAIIRNEMFFLPAFLDHYRRLGVERFIFLDDRSDDGTLEYILQQPDIMVLSSSRRYGDTLASPWSPGGSAEVRALYVWRTLLMERFCTEAWSLQVDLDEFVHLPEGQTFQNLIKRPDFGDARLVLGVMLDAYPPALSDLVRQRDDTNLDPKGLWYFDGETHLDIASRRDPVIVHPGARARLYWKHRLYHAVPETRLPLDRMFNQLIVRSRFGLRIPRFNTIHKPTLIRWKSGSRFFNSHRTDIEHSRKYLLPVLHFRFTGSLYRKIEIALAEGSYSGKSRDHRFLNALISRMSQTDPSFLYPASRCYSSFDDFRLTGNEIGLLPE